MPLKSSRITSLMWNVIPLTHRYACCSDILREDPWFSPSWQRTPDCSPFRRALSLLDHHLLHVVLPCYSIPVCVLQTFMARNPQQKKSMPATSSDPDKERCLNLIKHHSFLPHIGELGLVFISYLMGNDKDQHGRILARLDQVWAGNDVRWQLDSWQISTSQQ